MVVAQRGPPQLLQQRPSPLRIAVSQKEKVVRHTGRTMWEVTYVPHREDGRKKMSPAAGGPPVLAVQQVSVGVQVESAVRLSSEVPEAPLCPESLALRREGVLQQQQTSGAGQLEQPPPVDRSQPQGLPVGGHVGWSQRSQLWGQCHRTRKVLHLVTCTRK